MNCSVFRAATASTARANWNTLQGFVELTGSLTRRRSILGKREDGEVHGHLSRHDVTAVVAAAAILFRFVKFMETDEKVTLDGKINCCLDQDGQKV